VQRNKQCCRCAQVTSEHSTPFRPRHLLGGATSLFMYIYLYNCTFSVIPLIKSSKVLFAIIYLMWYVSIKISTLPFSGWEHRLERSTSFSYRILSTANFISLMEKYLHGTDELFEEKVFSSANFSMKSYTYTGLESNPNLIV